MEGKLCYQVISIFIDPGYNYGYISFDLVDMCCLNKEAHGESWLLKLAIGTNRRAHHLVRSYAFELNNKPTSTHLNVIPLGSYNIFLGMDWLFIT